MNQLNKNIFLLYMIVEISFWLVKSGPAPPLPEPASKKLNLRKI